MRIEERSGGLVVVDFTDLEACKIAANIEREGIAFYEALAGRLAGRAARETILGLARQEREHLAFFEDELARVRREKEDPFEEDDLADVLDSGIFRPYQDLAGAVKTPAKALSLGVLIEDRTVRFYDICRERTRSAAAARQLERIIGEEQAHARRLQAMRDALPRG